MPGVLWTLRETEKPDGTRDRWIGCNLLDGAGYKDLAEEMHPYSYDCPLEYLALAPVTCQEWRDGVIEYHKHHTTLACATAEQNRIRRAVQRFEELNPTEPIDAERKGSVMNRILTAGR